MDRFVALADPTRRRIVEMLGERALAAGEITAHFSMSAPAISQHLKVLREARLVRVQPAGASNIYFIDRHGLAAMRAWVDRMWGDALEAFREEINAEQEAER